MPFAGQGAAKFYQMLNPSKIQRLAEYLLIILALLGAFIFLQLSMSLELSDTDIWLHLKTGDYTLQNKAVVQADFYSGPALGKSWVNHSALTQITYYWLFNRAGPDGLIYFSSTVMLLAFLLLFFSAYKDKASLSLSVICVSLAIFASQVRFNIRPENFSVLFFCAYLFIFVKYKNKKTVFILPFIQLLWVNCHGFFILGPLLIALFGISGWLSLRKQLPWDWGESIRTDKKVQRNLIFVFILSVAVSLINPNGIKGALYPLVMIFQNIFHPNFIHRQIIELVAPWKLDYQQVWAYYLLLVVSFASFLFNFRKINFAYLLAWIVLLAASFNINRNIIFFNCLACLVCADNFSRMKNKLPALKYACLIAIIYISASSGLRLLEARYYLFEDNRFKSALLGVSDRYPQKAADFISQNKLPDNLFNTFNHGAYLIYRLCPPHHVFVDGRTELYGSGFFQDYCRILDADLPAADKLLDEYDINTVLLSGKLFEFKALAGHLYRSKDWALVYLNPDGLIFIRQAKQNQELLQRLRVELERWPVQKADLHKLGLRRVNPVPYLRLSRMLLDLGAEQKARAQAEEALKILPSAAEAYVVLGRTYLHKDTLEQAYQYLRLAAVYAPNSLSVLEALSDYYLQIGDDENLEATYKKIIKLFPEYAQGYYLLGRYYENKGNLPEAKKYLRKASGLAPYSAKYLNKSEEAGIKK